MIFDPIPSQPAGTSGTDLHTQALAVAIVWCLFAFALAARRRSLERRTVITLALLGLSGIGISLLIANPHWWLSFPTALRAIQFPFRLVTYLALVTAVAVAVLLAIPVVRRSRSAVALLVLATVWQVGIAGYLALTAKPRGAPIPPTPDNVRAGVVPPGFATGQRNQFRLATRNPVSPPVQQASVVPIGDDTPPQVHLFGSQPVGSLVKTPVVASPLIRFTGDASVIGATESGFEVLHVNRTPWRAAVSAVGNTCLSAMRGRAPYALLAGRLLSLIGAVALLSLVVAATRSLRGAVPRPLRIPHPRGRGAILDDSSVTPSLAIVMLGA